METIECRILNFVTRIPKITEFGKVLRIPKVDDIVIIKTEKLPRQQWPLGRITELLKSRDNQVRAVKVMVGKTRKVIERPVNLLYPLECNIERSEPTSIIASEPTNIVTSEPTNIVTSERTNIVASGFEGELPKLAKYDENLIRKYLSLISLVDIYAGGVLNKSVNYSFGQDSVP